MTAKLQVKMRVNPKTNLKNVRSNGFTMHSLYNTLPFIENYPNKKPPLWGGFLLHLCDPVWGVYLS